MRHCGAHERNEKHGGLELRLIYKISPQTAGQQHVHLSRTWGICSQAYDKYSAIIIDFVILIFLTIIGDTEGLSRGWGGLGD